MENSLNELKRALSRLRTRKDDKVDQLMAAEADLVQAKAEAETTMLTRALLQRVALITQEQIKYRVTGLGTLALEAVFPEPVELELLFAENRGKTEARLLFKYVDAEGKTRYADPLEADSGGLCDIAGLGLKCALREAQRPRTRPILVLDEPFGSINDPSREMHGKAASMIAEIGEKLGVQFIIISMVQELEKVGTKVSLGVGADGGETEEDSTEGSG